MDEPKPTHCWITRTLYLKGNDAATSHQIIHFEDTSDEGMARAFMDALVEFGQELSLGDYHPVRMDAGRYVIQSQTGFSVVEIDPAWTQAELDLLENAPKLDLNVWGGILHEGDE